jgi:hypothetical protein
LRQERYRAKGEFSFTASPVSACGFKQDVFLFAFMPLRLYASLPRCLVALLPLCLVASLPLCLVAFMPLRLYPKINSAELQE